MRSWTGWLPVSLAVIALDQLSKQWMLHAFSPGESLPVTGFFNLILMFNTGAAFSFLSAAGGWQGAFFAAIAVVASAVILYLLRKDYRRTLFSLALSLILGGALGNLIDRLLLGHVVDFLDFHYAGYHWPAFNVADSAITAGAALLVWDSLRRPAVKA